METNSQVNHRNRRRCDDGSLVSGDGDTRVAKVSSLPVSLVYMYMYLITLPYLVAYL